MTSSSEKIKSKAEDDSKLESKVTHSSRPPPSFQHLSISEIIQKEEIVVHPQKKSYLAVLMTKNSSSSSSSSTDSSKRGRRRKMKKKRSSGLSIVLSPRRRVPRYEDVSFNLPSNVTVSQLAIIMLSRFREFLSKEIPDAVKKIDSVRRLLLQLPENSRQEKLEVRWVFFVGDEKGEIDRSFPKFSKETQVMSSGRSKFVLKWRLNKTTENSMNRSHVFEFPIFIDQISEDTLLAKTVFVTWCQLRKTMCRIVDKRQSEDLTTARKCHGNHNEIDLSVSLNKNVSLKSSKSEPKLLYKGEDVKPRVVVSWAYVLTLN